MYMYLYMYIHCMCISFSYTCMVCACKCIYIVCVFVHVCACRVHVYTCTPNNMYVHFFSLGVTGARSGLSSIMSSRRFELILRFLHLKDSEAQPSRGQPGFSRLYKIQPFLDLLLQSFKNLYIPSQNLSIDESMISFKGRLSFLQYLPKKPHKWGPKAWVLADSLNGYTWAWKLYTGKETDHPVKGLAHRVVM